MSDKTAIEWTDATWNPVTGCTEVSAGCDHCYAKTFAERWRGTPGHYFENGFDVQLRPDKLDQPLRWKRPRRIFVNSMSDLFHDAVDDVFIGLVWQVMADCPQHTFQILTKRHARMRSFLSKWEPLPNVWLGVSTENQQWADIRIPALLDTPAAVRFISAEPLLGPIDLDNCGGYQAVRVEPDPTLTYLDWVIVGGESGRGARPMHPDWARSIRDQCVDAGVAFLFKQWGEHAPRCTLALCGHPCVCNGMARSHPIEMRRVGKKAAGRELDGRTWDQYPEEVTV